MIPQVKKAVQHHRSSFKSRILHEPTNSEKLVRSNFDGADLIIGPVTARVELLNNVCVIDVAAFAGAGKSHRVSIRIPIHVREKFPDLGSDVLVVLVDEARSHVRAPLVYTDEHTALLGLCARDFAFAVDPADPEKVWCREPQTCRVVVPPEEVNPAHLQPLGDAGLKWGPWPRSL